MPNGVLFIGFWVVLTVIVIALIKRDQKYQATNDRLLIIMSDKMQWYGSELAEACKDFLSRGKVYARLFQLKEEGLITSRLESPRTYSDGSIGPGKYLFSLTEEGYKHVEKSRSKASHE
jgi:DNA-binding PadR family transcriptional regulator